MTWTEAQMAAYRATAQQREQQRRDRLRQRCDLGQSVARQASDLLKQEFGAERVVLFGSMRSPDLVHERSDVDLAVGGLRSKDYFRAVGQLLAIHPDMPVDLVEAETASERLLQAIETTGIDL